MNVEMSVYLVIKMKCIECGSLVFNFDERIGETACSECGLISITEPFETSYTHDFENNWIRSRDTHVGTESRPRHILRGLATCNMVLSSVVGNSMLKDRIEEYYISLARKGVFRHTTIENRATALVYYVLKENRTPISLKKICAEFSCRVKSVNKIIRKIVLQFGNKEFYSDEDPRYMIKMISSQVTSDISYISRCLETAEFFEMVLKENTFNKTASYYPSICWITSNLFVHTEITQSLISEKTNVNRSNIRETTKKILSLIGRKNVTEIRGKEISELVVSKSENERYNKYGES
mgnify:FL=1